MSCAYAFILTHDQQKKEGLKAVARKSDHFLGNVPILSFLFAEFQPWSILLTFIFPFCLTWYSYFVHLIHPVFLFTSHSSNLVFEWLESIIHGKSQMAGRPSSLC